MVLLEIEQLTKKYKNITAVDSISLHVNSGEIVALIGENGAGKSTILNCLEGSISLTEGTITYKSKPLSEKNSLHNELGFLNQANFFDYMNAYDNLEILLQLTGNNNKEQNQLKIMNLLQLVGLQKKYNKYVKTFSYGMKQRLGLAQALIQNPLFLVLDEPFIGLDPIGKKILKKIITEKAKKEKGGILFSSHDLEDVIEICDRVIMLKKGKIVYDDVFQTTKHYVIHLEQEIEAVNIVKKQENVQQRHNCIFCSSYEVFHEVYLLALNEKIHIKDIEIQEDSLYQLFKGENLYENTYN